MSDSTSGPQAEPLETSQSDEMEQSEAIANDAGKAAAADPEAPSFGWNAYAERTNGRFAMVGFVVLLVMELFTRQDFWTWIGF